MYRGSIRPKSAALVPTLVRLLDEALELVGKNAHGVTPFFVREMEEEPSPASGSQRQMQVRTVLEYACPGAEASRAEVNAGGCLRRMPSSGRCDNLRSPPPTEEKAERRPAGRGSMRALFHFFFLVFGWALLIVGLLLIILAFPATDAHRQKQVQLAAMLEKAGMRRSDIPIVDVGPAPLLALGGIIAGLGVHLLAIRPRALYYPCPTCAANVHEDEVKCRHCGTWVTSD
jgi:hypothetical protein